MLPKSGDQQPLDQSKGPKMGIFRKILRHLTDRKRLKTIFIELSIFVTLLIIAGAGFLFWSYRYYEKVVSEKLDSRKILRPTEYYSAPITFSARMKLTPEEVLQIFNDNHYRSREVGQNLMPGDYFLGTPQSCQAINQIEPLPVEINCLGFINISVTDKETEKNVQFIYFQIEDQPAGPPEIMISRTFNAENLDKPGEVALDPKLIAQYLGNEPTLRKEVTLGDVPTLCLRAVMAIEDDKFLEHGGFSVTGIARALLKNLVTGRRAQGGSTITQQLVKNYFLSNERAYRRKLRELIMSVIMENKFSKDEILETYLNVIYMGQNGPFRIHGYGAAANYYFNRDLNELGLSECALLAATLNGPAIFNPFKNPEKTIKRRALVLERMYELKYISKQELDLSLGSPLPKEKVTLPMETAPYFLDAVRKQMISMNLPIEGSKIFTSLNLKEQLIAQEALRKHIENLEEKNKYLQAQKAKKNLLEGLVLAGDPRTGLVSVVVGGRSYRMTQFNRAIDSHRQVGSIMKPFVFLTGLLNKDPSGKPYLPWTQLKDEKFETKYEGQRWSPDNYGNKYFGEVPMFFALKNSLNAATASLGISVGINNVLNTAKDIGISSDLKPLPSLTLGAFELYPKEVLQAYMTFSQMGRRPMISFIRQVVGEEGVVIFKKEDTPSDTISPEAIAMLVSMMKQTIISGTARMISLSGFTNPAAGKTGTTSDNKDAWFAGFTPYKTTVVWVGYDNNTPHHLTGTSGAVPIWLEFMKKTNSIYPADDFNWPTTVEKVILDTDKLKTMNALQPDDDTTTTVELMVPKGTTPN